MLTQAELAAAVDARQASISAWETSDARPNMTSRRKLCVALGVSPDELLAALDRDDQDTAGEGSPPPAP